MTIKRNIKVKKKARILKLTDYLHDGSVEGVELSKDSIVPEFYYCWIREGDLYLIHEKSNNELSPRIAGLEDNEKDASWALYEFAIRRAKMQKVGCLGYTKNGETISKTPDDLLEYIKESR